MDITSGETVSGLTLNNGWIDVYSGGVTIDTVLSDSGIETVWPGGVASGTVLEPAAGPGAIPGFTVEGSATGTIISGSVMTLDGTQRTRRSIPRAFWTRIWAASSAVR